MRARAVGWAVVLGLVGCVIGENPYWNPDVTTSQGSSGTTTVAGVTSGGSTVGPVTTEGSPSTTGPLASTGTTGPEGTMGQPCAAGPCDEGQSCCRSLQCLDTCLIFCALDPGVCPPEMLCAHGYCLLRCDDDDADCVSWPGFTCEHGGAACENYEPPDSTGGSAGSSTG